MMRHYKGTSDEITTDVLKKKVMAAKGELPFSVTNINDYMKKFKFDNVHGCRYDPRVLNANWNRTYALQVCMQGTHNNAIDDNIRHFLEFWWTGSDENVSTGQNSSANAPYQRRSQSTNNMYCWWVYTSSTRDVRTTTLKGIQINRETPEIQKEEHTNAGGDFNAELGPGYVGPHTLKERNKRLDWMKQWLLQNFKALNTMCRKTSEKQATCRTPKRTEKQLAYILVDRKHMYCIRDAEANDTTHMGSDHRSVMAQFVITEPKKEVAQKTHIAKKKTKTAESTKSQDDEKTWSDEANKFEERYAELERKIKHEAEIAATTQKPKMT